MKAIVNVNSKWAIGYQGKLLYSFPEDMKRFKELTMNKAIVYGRKTLISFPGQKPLEHRTNIVVSSSKDNIPETAKKGCDYYAYINRKNYHGRDIGITGITFNHREYSSNDNSLLNTSLVLISNINYAKDTAMFLGHCPDDIIICGGASIYKQMLPLCDTVYVTKNNYEIENVFPDAYFPNLDEMTDEWYISYREGKMTSNDARRTEYEFLVYKRK